MCKQAFVTKRNDFIVIVCFELLNSKIVKKNESTQCVCVCLIMCVLHLLNT